MRDYAELSKSVHCCVGCEESQCEICPRGDTPFSYIECKRKLSDDAADAIEELLAAVPQWISVEERLPEVNERVLACVGIPGDLIVYDGVRWNGEEWEAEVEAAYDYWTTIDDPVTHWMPLPEPPKEVE